MTEFSKINSREIFEQDPELYSLGLDRILSGSKFRENREDINELRIKPRRDGFFRNSDLLEDIGSLYSEGDRRDKRDKRDIDPYMMLDSRLMEQEYSNFKGNGIDDKIFNLETKNSKYIIENNGASFSNIINYSMNKNPKIEIMHSKKESDLKQYISQNEIIFSKERESGHKNLEEVILSSDMGLGNIINDFREEGYDILRTIKPQHKSQSIFDPEIANVAPDILEVPNVGVVVGDMLPEVIMPLFADVRKTHPAAWYDGMTVLGGVNKQDVQVHTFKYLNHGKEEEVNYVMKNGTFQELVLPKFLQSIGANGYSTASIAGNLVMQHVGGVLLQDVIVNGSESEMRSAMHLVIDEMAKIQVAATGQEMELERDYGLVMEHISYERQMFDRFVTPVTGSRVITPEIDAYLKAYSAFAKAMDIGPLVFAHTDFHGRNSAIVGDKAYVFDWEDAKFAGRLHDTATIVNAGAHYRPDVDREELTRDMYNGFVESRNNHAKSYDAPLMMDTPIVARAFKYAMINDQMDKAGVAVLMACANPTQAEMRIGKSKTYLANAFDMIDGEMMHANEIGNSADYSMLYNLRNSLVEMVAASPVHALREIADNYKDKVHEPVIIRLAA